MINKFLATIAVTTVLICAAGICLAATLTKDPLTGLPLDPATDPVHFGNAPQVLPEFQLCKSKVQMDFYSNVNSKQDAIVAWYAAHLQGFHQNHSYIDKRSMDMFYNDAGTVVVSVVSVPGKEGEKVDTHAITYYAFQPGLSAAAIKSFGQHETKCN
ncbi:MAG TPA: hypothetical protein VH088_11825 [Terriglobales bacterium]|nr:hypothetical protein [Terriglobales bacterium]